MKHSFHIKKSDLFGLALMIALLVGAVAVRCAIFVPRYL